MTRTEERLRDALLTAASRVQDDALRPLAAPGRRIPESAPRAASRRRTWLPPLAAAASVALIAIAVVAVAGYLQHRNNAPAPTSPAAGPPRYYATLEGNNRTNLEEVIVRATATGAVVTRVPDPVSPLPRGTGTAAPPSSTATPNPNASLMQPLDIATTDDRTFYVVYGIQTVTGYGDLVIESFRLSNAGQPSPLIQVNGGQLSGQGTTRAGGSWVNPRIGGFAVSPDNGKIALALKASSSSTTSDEILVIDTRTGSHAVWRGGLDRPNAAFAILGLSWTSDGRSLAFLAQWCSPPQRAFSNTGSDVCGGATRSAQVRELDTTSAGGSLSSARLLLAQSARYPYIARALISPDGTSLTAILLSGPVPPGTGLGPNAPERLSVVRISVGTGTVTATFFQGVDPVSVWSTLTADSSGRYLMLTHTDVSLRPGDTRYAVGWIDAGHFRQLPLNPDGQPVAW
jgi:hypothetical protein